MKKLSTFFLAVVTASTWVANGQSEFGYGGRDKVKENGYGAGINVDQYGGSHVYRTSDGRQLNVVEQEGVRRNGYGAGVHVDKYGRAVYDSKP
jgi:hypothetical protein